ncbi:hypothetical protein CLOM_g23479 [Closterium sp. NIES-68]|nr:hypothetical protein CLOM_g23479 [Closterium sp. NIES-68]
MARKPRPSKRNRQGRDSAGQGVQLSDKNLRLMHKALRKLARRQEWQPQKQSGRAEEEEKGEEEGGEEEEDEGEEDDDDDDEEEEWEEEVEEEGVGEEDDSEG